MTTSNSWRPEGLQYVSQKRDNVGPILSPTRQRARRPRPQPQRRADKAAPRLWRRRRSHRLGGPPRPPPPPRASPTTSRDDDDRTGWEDYPDRHHHLGNAARRSGCSTHLLASPTRNATRRYFRA